MQRLTSPPPEIRHPPFFGCLDAFLEILGGAQPRLFGELMVGCGEHAVIGNIVPDFPLINKSFNLSYSGQDL